MTSRLLLEYEGTQFGGWARQPGRRTVQDVVEEALARLARGTPIPTVVAGRTDAGVHAWGQVVSHPGPSRSTRALNAVLPPDVAVLRSELAPDGFNARRDATSRAYCYRILTRPERSPWERGRALWHPRPLDREVLRACADALRGRRDFRAFTPSQSRQSRFTRTISSAAWRDHGDRLDFWIEGDSFLRHMIRILMGTMLEAAVGLRDGGEGFAALLDGAPRSAAGRTAPACGLYLVGAGYGGARVL